MGKTRSNFWFLLPVFLGLIGGIIGYFAIKNDDSDKAGKVFLLGLGLFFVGIALNFFAGIGGDLSAITPFSFLT